MESAIEIIKAINNNEIIIDNKISINIAGYKITIEKKEEEPTPITTPTNDNTEEEEEEEPKRIATVLNKFEFLDWFKSNFVDDHKRIIIRKFTNYLKTHNEEAQHMNSTNMKKELLENHCIYMKGTNNKISDEGIFKIYAIYFNYVKDSEE